MNLSDMANFVAARTGSSDEASITRAKEFIRARYQMIYDSHLWEDSKAFFSMETDDPVLTLPNWCDRVLEVRFENTETNRLIRLDAVQKESLFMVNAEIFDLAGDPLTFSPLPPVATHTSPEGQTLKVWSDSGDDAVEVRIRGYHNGLESAETITLAGETVIGSTNIYDDVMQFSKPETVGNVHLTGANDEELQILLPTERQRRHVRIQLHPDTWSEFGLLVMAKRTFVPLEHDYDVPVLSGVENALVAYATADMLERQRQFGKAQVKVGEASALVLSLLERERNQRTLAVRIIPDESFYGLE